MPRDPYFVFDLDGTLIDNVYLHILAWQRAFASEGLTLSAWRIHRKIGMSGDLLVHELVQETGAVLNAACADRVHAAHGTQYRSMADAARVLPGARALLEHLTQHQIAWAIATSGHADNAAPALALLGIDANSATIVTGDQVRAAKPAPDLFIGAAARLNRPIEDALVVGDSVWDMLGAVRARALGVGLLSGGYSASELREAGAYRVFNDPADVLDHLGELTSP